MHTGWIVRYIFYLDVLKPSHLNCLLEVLIADTCSHSLSTRGGQGCTEAVVEAESVSAHWPHWTLPLLCQWGRYVYIHYRQSATWCKNTVTFSQCFPWKRQIMQCLYQEDNVEFPSPMVWQLMCTLNLKDKIWDVFRCFCSCIYELLWNISSNECRVWEFLSKLQKKFTITTSNVQAKGTRIWNKPQNEIIVK